MPIWDSKKYSSMCCGGFDEQFLDFLIQTKQHFSKTDNHDA
jgi:hypothetical protein